MAFVMESIPMEKWEFVNKYVPSRKCSEYSIWWVDYEKEAYWIKVEQNALEHLEYYLLIWKEKKAFVGTYGWIEKSGDRSSSFSNIILFQADVSLRQDKEELVQIVREVLEFGHDGNFVIKEMTEPDFSREIQ